MLRDSSIAAMLRITPAAAILIALALPAGGCATGDGAVVVQDAASLENSIATSDKPVMVMFYKQGCASCAALEPTMDNLAREYRGRVLVEKFMILTFVYTSPAPAIKEKYDIVFVPHVILFDHGQSRNTWTSFYDVKEYRKAMDALVGPASQPAPARP
jgi:thioredoxin 1